MASIGSLTVDLDLNSAAFADGLSKATQSTAQSAAAMSQSLDALGLSFNRVSLIAGSFLGADFALKAIIGIKELVTQSLSLAEAMGGPVTDAVSGVETLLSDIKGAFDFGVAQGFIDGIKSINDGLDLTDAQFLEITKSGKAFGELVGKSLLGLVHGFDDIRKGISGMGEELDTFGEHVAVVLDSVEGFFNRLAGIQNAMPTFGGDPGGFAANVTNVAKSLSQAYSDATANTIAFNRAQAELMRDMKDDPSFWDANTRATQGWTEALKHANTILDSSRGPLEALQERLLEISLLEHAGILTVSQAANANVEATAKMAEAWGAVAVTASGALTSIFKDNKAVAIANAVINTAESITKSLAVYGFTPIGIAAAAAAALAGAAQIAAIEAAQPGSSTKPSAIASGGGKGASSSAAAPAPSQIVNLQLIGSNYTRAQVIDLMNSIKKLQKDGYTLN